MNKNKTKSAQQLNCKPKVCFYFWVSGKCTCETRYVAVGVFLQECHHWSVDCEPVQRLCSHLGWSAWWFFSGQPNQFELHSCAAFSRQLFTHQVFPGVRVILTACAFLLTLTGADAVRPELPGIPAARAAPWSAGRWGRTPAEATGPWKQTPVTVGHVTTVVRWITAICIHVHSLLWTLCHLGVTCNTILPYKLKVDHTGWYKSQPRLDWLFYVGYFLAFSALFRFFKRFQPFWEVDKTKMCPQTLRFRANILSSAKSTSRKS